MTTTAMPNRPQPVTFDLWFAVTADRDQARLQAAWLSAIARRNSFLRPVRTSYRTGQYVVRIEALYPDRSSNPTDAARLWGDRLIKASELRWPGTVCRRASLVSQ